MATFRIALRTTNVIVMFILACLSPSIALATEAGSEIVGEITTAIGNSIVRHQSGKEAPATKGQHIHTGDRIETLHGGHVHIRFIDGGMVSVRPLSRLQIEAYRNSNNQTLAAIKFKLEEGVVRSVTGQWGEASRDRFRLNTPVAAIGVKGTDFIVKADSQKTFASVVSGAIVMAPLEGTCATGLGPCQGDRSAMLSAEMQGKMLELIQHNGTPRIVPAVDLLARQGNGEAQNNRPTSAIGSTDTNNLILVSDAKSKDALGNNMQSSGATRQSLPLVWLHNTLGWNVPDNTISERYDAARVAGRTAVIGNFFITLYRDETQQTSFQPIGSTASFRLTSASATFTQPIAYGRPAETVQISNAALNVDFGHATFATHLNLASPSLGQETIRASGAITPQGTFVANESNQNIAGAFSTNGLQAGYQFDKTVGNGKVSGLTLWVR